MDYGRFQELLSCVIDNLTDIHDLEDDAISISSLETCGDLEAHFAPNRKVETPPEVDPPAFIEPELTFDRQFEGIFLWLCSQIIEDNGEYSEADLREAMQTYLKDGGDIQPNDFSIWVKKMLAKLSSLVHEKHCVT